MTKVLSLPLQSQCGVGAQGSDPKHMAQKADGTPQCGLWDSCCPGCNELPSAHGGITPLGSVTWLGVPANLRAPLAGPS